MCQDWSIQCICRKSGKKFDRLTEEVWFVTRGEDSYRRFVLKHHCFMQLNWALIDHETVAVSLFVRGLIFGLK